MAGETIKTPAICLAIRPWSRTSHVTAWLTPTGCITTVVKGAVRPKSAFLGQYDLNYTCEILFYARAKGELHALRECAPISRRDALRNDFRALALADWFRRLALDLSPTGPEAGDWYNLLERSLDGLTTLHPPSSALYLQHLLSYELATLSLAGLALDFAGEGSSLRLRGEREIPVSAEVRACLDNPSHENNPKILVEAARVISVYYSFHLDCAPDVRRIVLRMIYR